MKVYVAMKEVVSENDFGVYLFDVCSEYYTKEIKDQLALYLRHDVNPADMGHASKCLGVFRTRKEAVKACHDALSELEGEYLDSGCEYHIKKDRPYGDCMISETMCGVAVDCFFVEEHNL